VVLTVTPTETRAEYRYVDNFKARTYTAVVGKTLRMLPGAANRTLVAA
jgi:alkaline phosphatase D